MCGRKHEGKCLGCTSNFYICGNNVHMKMDFPMLKDQGRKNAQTQESGLNSDAPKKNCFYALQSRGDHKCSPDVVLVCCKIFN